METEDTEPYAEEPFTAYGRYSYADYLTWEIDEMVELIKGKVFRQAAAPKLKHQKISFVIAGKLYDFLKGKNVRGLAHPLMSVYPDTPK